MNVTVFIADIKDRHHIHFRCVLHFFRQHSDIQELPVEFLSDVLPPLRS